MHLTHRLSALLVLTLAFPLPTLGAGLFTDVSTDAWYADPVQSLAANGYLDASGGTFRPGDAAKRAEVVKLLVTLKGGILSPTPQTPTFDDVPKAAWSFSYLEEAAKESWVRGEGNCRGKHPCYARPDGPVTRAEMATLIVRAYGLTAQAGGPVFTDNPSGQWYSDAITAASDNCVLQGDDETGRVRPLDPVNRAEMAAMLHRIESSLNGSGPVCEQAIPDESGTVMEIDSVTAQSAVSVQASFTGPLDPEKAANPALYVVSGAGDVAEITGVTLTDDDTVLLTLRSPLGKCGGELILQVNDLPAADGTTFTDSRAFRFACVQGGAFQPEVALVPLAGNKAEYSLRRGDENVEMLNMQVSAPCASDLVINGLTVHHTGTGNSLDITHLHAAVDGKIISDGAYIWRDRSWTFDFDTPVTLAACDSAVFGFRADFASESQPRVDHTLVIRGSGSIASDATGFRGAFPLKGALFRVY